MRDFPTPEDIEELLADGGPELVFQPIYELESRRLVGLEALSRFFSARFHPAEWFAAAHAYGFGTELELTAVALALECVDSLPDDVCLAVNVSPAIAVHDAFYEWVRPYADRVVVELTEIYATDDYPSLSLALNRIRAAGATVAVDDVGVGFSTLEHMRCVAPDLVKLDLSLTRAAGLTHEGRVQALAYVRAARAVGAVVAAEGIETAAELETMRALGVERGQGYFLAPPAPLDEAIAPHFVVH